MPVLKMSQKLEENGQESMHKSRREMLNGGGITGTVRKRYDSMKFSDPSGRKLGDDSRRKKNAVNRMKKRIRDLQRLLGHSQNLPADVRIVRERELNALQQECDAAAMEIQRSEMIGKYHMVRFFERQKATRYLKQAQRQLGQAKDDERSGSLMQELHALEVDLNYTTHYPLAEKYASLYVKQNVQGRERYLPNRNQPMWRTVEFATEQGTLEELRDGRKNYRRSENENSILPSNERKGNADMKAQTEISKGKGRKEQRTKPTKFRTTGKVEDKNDKIGDGSSNEDEDGGGFFER